MKKQLATTFVFVICTFSKSFAAEISGQVVTAEGTPVCAMVLASGKSMFSCDPMGQYELKFLPLEPDGSVNLQVYAEGFYPYHRNITQFGAQSDVIMPRAGSCPVDDGLSDTSRLDGTYRLIRGTIYFNDGVAYDTANSSSRVEATGTMEINGNYYSQRVDITINGVPQVPAIASGPFTDYGWAVVPTNGDPVVLVERGAKFTTFVNRNAVGNTWAEVDHWLKVTNTVVSSELDMSMQSYVPSTYPMGGVLGGMAEELGLKSLPNEITAK